MTVRVRTEEFERNGIPMYRVVGIHGVLQKDKLDEEYTAKMPSFWLTSTRKTLKLCDGTTLSVNGVYRKPVFMRILKQITQGGDRLHAMNREKYIAKIAKQVQHIVQKREAPVDVIIGNKTFKI
jgi:hypothetical protein